MKHKIIIPETATSDRLDKVLIAQWVDLGIDISRARLQVLIKTGHVGFVKDGKSVIIFDPNHRVTAGEEYTIDMPPTVSALPEAQSMPLTILHEDEDLLVLNKPAGIVVHPAAGNRDHTLVNALLAHCGKSLSGIGGVARPGIVHRLDKDTSGLMVVAKNDNAHKKLSAQFADRSLSRVYQALVWGIPGRMSGEIEGAIGRDPRNRKKMAIVKGGGRRALTHYRVLETFGSIASLVECKLATGRTHQIRVHMSSIGHPVVGDQSYGGAGRSIKGAKKASGTLIERLNAIPRQALHAVEIKFVHPSTDKKMRFKSGLPPDMAALLKYLRKAMIKL
ncbi:MAG: RluA family pseudouridine synthase [Alphaproteobacteria bacterium]|nr:RluA family pseudouridine synthase [Alphaproteobacteria bacterium]